MSDYTSPVDQLLRLGDPRDREEIPITSLGLGPEQIPDLIRIATDRDLSLSDENSPEVWAPLHAWRALGELHAEEAVEPLLELLDFLVVTEDDWCVGELPEVFASIGPAAIPALADFLADSRKQLFARICVSEAFDRIRRLHPDSREECVAVLTNFIAAADCNDSELNGFVLAALLDLNAVESAAVIELAFNNGLIDCSIAGDWEEVQYELGLTGPPERAILSAVRIVRLGSRLNYYPGPMLPAKQKLKQKARRKLASKSRKLNRKRR